MRAPQQRSTELSQFITPRSHYRFRFEVGGVEFFSLEEAERHAVYEKIRHPDQPAPKIFCRRRNHASYFKSNTP
jgi:hypothetical protein